MGVDGLTALAATGSLSRDEMQRLWVDVQANHARLDGCKYHDFEPISGCRPLKQKYRCRHCGGEIDSHAMFWHEQGRRPRPAS